jgi:hypothetical protein
MSTTLDTVSRNSAACGELAEERPHELAASSFEKDEKRIEGARLQLAALSKSREGLGLIDALVGTTSGLDRQIQAQEMKIRRLEGLKDGSTKAELRKIETEALIDLREGVAELAGAERAASYAYETASISKTILIEGGSAVASVVLTPAGGAAYRAGVGGLVNLAEETSSVAMGTKTLNEASKDLAGALVQDAVSGASILVGGKVSHVVAKGIIGAAAKGAATVAAGAGVSLTRKVMAYEVGSLASTTVTNALDASGKLIRGESIDSYTLKSYGLNYISGAIGASVGVCNSNLITSQSTIGQKVAGFSIDAFSSGVTALGQDYLQNGQFTEEGFRGAFSSVATSMAQGTAGAIHSRSASPLPLEHGVGEKSRILGNGRAVYMQEPSQVGQEFSARTGEAGDGVLAFYDRSRSQFVLPELPANASRGQRILHGALIAHENAHRLGEGEGGAFHAMQTYARRNGFEVILKREGVTIVPSAEVGGEQSIPLADYMRAAYPNVTGLEKIAAMRELTVARRREQTTEEASIGEARETSRPEPRPSPQGKRLSTTPTTLHPLKDVDTPIALQHESAFLITDSAGFETGKLSLERNPHSGATVLTLQHTGERETAFSAALPSASTPADIARITDRLKHVAERSHSNPQQLIETFQELTGNGEHNPLIRDLIAKTTTREAPPVDFAEVKQRLPPTNETLDPDALLRFPKNLENRPWSFELSLGAKSLAYEQVVDIASRVREQGVPITVAKKGDTFSPSEWTIHFADASNSSRGWALQSPQGLLGEIGKNEANVVMRLLSTEGLAPKISNVTPFYKEFVHVPFERLITEHDRGELVQAIAAKNKLDPSEVAMGSDLKLLQQAQADGVEPDQLKGLDLAGTLHQELAKLTWVSNEEVIARSTRDAQGALPLYRGTTHPLPYWSVSNGAGRTGVAYAAVQLNYAEGYAARPSINERENPMPKVGNRSLGFVSVFRENGNPYFTNFGLEDGKNEIPRATVEHIAKGHKFDRGDLSPEDQINHPYGEYFPETPLTPQNELLARYITDGDKFAEIPNTPLWRLLLSGMMPSGPERNRFN